MKVTKIQELEFEVQAHADECTHLRHILEENLQQALQGFPERPGYNKQS